MTPAAPIRPRSLEGRVVVVTRPRDQSGELVRSLRERGATAVLAPTIRLTRARGDSMRRAVRELSRGGFEWVVFTSRAGVEAIADLVAGGDDGPIEIRARVAAVGEGTARALRLRSVMPDLVPRTFTTEALGRAFPRGSGRVLLARADIAQPELEALIESKGWTPVRVDAYRTRAAPRIPPDASRVLRERSADAVTFTSASTVEGFVDLAGVEAVSGRGRPRVVCIGPVTARAATAAGMKVDAVARPHTIDGLVAAVERVLGARGHSEESR